MRTWQSSITAWTRSSPESVMRSFSARVGATAKVTTSAPSTAKSRSGMRRRWLPDLLGLGFDVLEEAVDRPPHLGSTREAAPARADQPDQLVAAIDRVLFMQQTVSDMCLWLEFRRVLFR